MHVTVSWSFFAIQTPPKRRKRESSLWKKSFLWLPIRLFPPSINTVEFGFMKLQFINWIELFWVKGQTCAHYASFLSSSNFRWWPNSKKKFFHTTSSLWKFAISQASFNDERLLLFEARIFLPSRGKWDTNFCQLFLRCTKCTQHFPQVAIFLFPDAAWGMSDAFWDGCKRRKTFSRLSA